MNDPPLKIRRIHLNAIDCAAYSSTEEGSRALTNPSSVPKSSRDRNAGLRPRSSKATASISKSPSIESESSTQKQSTSDSQVSYFSQGPSQFVSSREYFASYSNNTNMLKKRRSKYPKQSNSLLNYFSSDKKCAESTTSNVARESEDIMIGLEHPALMNEETASEEVFDSIYEEERKKGLSQEIFLESLLQEEIKCKEMHDVVSTTDVSDASNTAEDSDYDIYGLLGTGNVNSTCEMTSEPDYFQQLPTHVFELILCHIPFLDLMLNLKRVAKYWNEVISNQKFLYWKKKYFKLKSDVDGAEHEIQANCVRLKMDNIWNCLHGLIKYMREFSLTPVSDMHENLKRHPKYTWAEDIVTQRAADCVKNGVPNPWSLVAALVIVSETMWDIYDIFRYLIHPKSLCPVPDLLECLYCIASFLYYFQNNHKINHGLHYRVYYAVYTYENQWKGGTDNIKALQVKSIGQQSILKYSLPTDVRLTHEQMLIVNHHLKHRQVVKVVAFAGAGKTSTLVEYTRLRPHLKFLNVMYNKSVCDHAKSCFPPNVECRTAHSLAWAAVGNRYVRKLTSSLKPLHIMSLLKNSPKEVGERYRYAYCVLTTVEEFMATANEFITIAHAPSITTVDGETRVLEHKERMNIVKDAENLWSQMIDPKNPAQIIHDVYLKLYQLSHPDLSSYDCIIVDEAQDCNGAMLNIVLSQHCPKILVGDPNQQIYSFHGATNALDKVKSTHTYYLTQSFRFGPEIAYIASCTLEVLKNVSSKTLVGGTQPGSVLGKKEGQLAIIARTNVTLFNEAVRLCCSNVRKSEEPSHILGCFSGGLKGYNLDQIVDIQKLMSIESAATKNDGVEIKDKFVKRFSSFSALQKYAQNTKDADLLAKIKLVLLHHENIPTYVQTIKEKCHYPLDMANVVFTTAHKSKGLEFDTVSITDDFTVGNVPYSSGNINTQALLQEEFNILYVAITRAKKCLCLPVCVYYMLLGAQEKFEHLVPRKQVECEETVIKCCSCDSDVLADNKNPFLLARRELTLSNDRKIEKGFMCTDCATSPVFVPSFPNSNFAMQITRPIEDFAHESLSQFVGPLLGSNDLDREKMRRLPLWRNNIFLALHNENFAENIFFLI